MTGHGKYAYKNDRAKTRRAARRDKTARLLAFMAWHDDALAQSFGLGQ